MLKFWWGVVRNAGREWNKENTQLEAAGLAFFFVMSFIPLMIIAMTLAGMIFGQGTAENEIVSWAKTLLDSKVAEALDSMLQAARASSTTTLTFFSFALVFYAGTHVFNQMTAALNKIWHKGKNPRRGIKVALRNRFVSLLSVFVVGIFLAVFSSVDALLKLVQSHYGEVFSIPYVGVWRLMSNILSFGVFIAIFGLLYQHLPDAPIRWAEVWPGALIASALFMAGRLLVSLYFKYRAFDSLFGKAGSLIVVMLWGYVIAQIFLFGAQISRTYATSLMSDGEPSTGNGA